MAYFAYWFRIVVFALQLKLLISAESNRVDTETYIVSTHRQMIELSTTKWTCNIHSLIYLLSKIISSNFQQKSPKFLTSDQSRFPECIQLDWITIVSKQFGLF